MPSFRGREQFEFHQLDGAYFWMRDCADQVLCKISHKALRDRNGLDGGDADLEATFVRHRVRIEMVAGIKYEKGHLENDLILILSKDLTPLSA
jgi:Protein of unknown function (DUF1488)